jgi:hypothetical protein
MPNGNARLVRAAPVVVGGIAVEAVLRLIVWTAPVTRTLVAPVYWLVGAGVIFGVWRATRDRATMDRRKDGRRHH